jgi:glycosyltransferase involved in cell wall biosynthesis
VQRSGIRAFGVNVIGHVSGNLGLGVLARHVVSLLLSLRCPIRILDIDPQLGRGGHDQRFAEYTVATVGELIYPVTLLIFPPIAIVSFLRDRRNHDLLLQGDGLNAALVNWEQILVPTEWASVLSGLDVLVAPSAFTRETFQEAIPDVPVISAKVPLCLPEAVRENRARFRLQPDLVWFGSSFEPQSDLARKNPFAVLDAFQGALANRRDVGLVFKVNNPTAHGRSHPAINELRVRAQGDGRVVLIEDSLDYHGVLSLYASIDVYVSLHRSEGIGLALMEAMALAKPVVATGWSGNMSFMDRSNACIVSYDLVPVRSTSHVYSQAVLGKQAVWAEPDIANASEWMRALVQRPDLRSAIGQSAQQAMKRYQDEAQRGFFLEQLRLIRESEIVWGIGHGPRRTRRARLHHSMFEWLPPSSNAVGGWMEGLRSLARKAGLRRRHLRPWTPSRRP